jgi:serpin B
MASTLHFTLAGDALPAAFDAMDLALARRGTEVPQNGGAPFALSIADAIWGQQGFPFLAAYLDLLATYYGAGLMNVDFIDDPDGSRQEINTWVSDQTNAKIQNLLPEGSVTGDTRLVLTNAIYFKASWDTPFDSKVTTTGTFTRLDGSTVQAPMMQRGDSYAYAETDAYQAVSLPYVGKNVSMVVIVPKGSFADFETALTGDVLGTLLGSLTATSGSVTLPKFGTQSAFSLKDALTALGMTDAFMAADFSGMDGQTDLFISDVIHKSFVAVDEAGTEAAAATAVLVSGGAAPENPFTLTADKPFVFAIVDGPTGAVLFLGRVLDPSAG